MPKKQLINIDPLFDRLSSYWESKKSSYLISSVLVATFVLLSLCSVLVINDIILLGAFTHHFKNPFFSIEVVFTMLLITELFGLIFILPTSVSKSVSKQFELISLIFLRDGFKAFSHMGSNFSWEATANPLKEMMVYGFGAIAIFFILGLNSKLQKHVKISTIEDDQEKFIRLKKMLALLLLIAFGVVGYLDVKALILTGYYLHSFHTFYTILIFSDIIIVLVALRYTMNYFKIFRYSAFVLATILIRISLSLEVYYDVLIAVSAAIFVLILTLVYNYFTKEIVAHQLTDSN